MIAPLILTHLLFVSFSVLDFLVGLLTQPLALICRVSEILGRLDVNCPARLLKSIVGVACLGTSIFHICFISVERYVAVRFPCSYKTLFTNCRVTITVLLIWLFMITYAILPYTLYPEVGSLIGRSVIIGINLLVTGVCYMGTLIEVGAALKVRPRPIQVCPAINKPASCRLFTNPVKLEIPSCKKNNNPQANGEKHLSSTETESCQFSKARQFEEISLRRKIKEKKLARAMLFLVGILGFCYFPAMIAYILLPKNQEARPTNWIILSWLHFLLYCNSVVNPFCYCWRIPILRKAVCKLVCKT